MIHTCSYYLEVEQAWARHSTARAQLVIKKGRLAPLITQSLMTFFSIGSLLRVLRRLQDRGGRHSLGRDRRNHHQEHTHVS